MIRVLLTPLVAISFVARAEAKPWSWWPARTPAQTPVKTVLFALPACNGGVISVTLPAKPAIARGGAGHRRTQDSPVDLHDDERIAADLERHF